MSLKLANRHSQMMLYSDNVNPVCHAVRIVLKEKDIINAHILYVSDEKNIPDDITDLNPYRTHVTLVDRELVLYNPHIIIEYLDERFPHPPLMPVDPVSRAHNRQFRYRVMKDLYKQIEILEDSSEISLITARQELTDNLTAMAEILKENPYFMSEEYSLVDCFIAPLLWRLPLYGMVRHIGSAAPLLKDYALRLFNRDAFLASLSEEEKEYRSIQAFERL